MNKPKFRLNETVCQQAMRKTKPLQFNLSKMGILGYVESMEKMEVEGNDNTEEMVVVLWNTVKFLLKEQERLQDKLERSNVKWK